MDKPNLMEVADLSSRENSTAEIPKDMENGRPAQRNQSNNTSRRKVAEWDLQIAAAGDYQAFAEKTVDFVVESSDRLVRLVVEATIDDELLTRGSYSGTEIKWPRN